ncbi:MAG: DNA-binding protein WhiA, partial [Oscillospiraceae bacterium]|nr:DNA-binding protein WhiA [Oscillospiraceae bacterium]
YRFGEFSENMGINSAVVSGNDDESGAFLRGVFVSCGSVTDPKKEYHLELVLPYKARAAALHTFINEHGMAIKTTQRGRGLVLYAKESELIEDFLTYIGAALRSLEIMQVKIEKSVRNHVNRTVNCETANLDKTIDAANRICEDIKLLLRERGADYLKPELRKTALLRLENREASLSELCELLSDQSPDSKPLSKSGLNHRLKKLSKMAEELRAQTSDPTEI